MSSQDSVVGLEELRRSTIPQADMDQEDTSLKEATLHQKYIDLLEQRIAQLESVVKTSASNKVADKKGKESGTSEAKKANGNDANGDDETTKVPLMDCPGCPRSTKLVLIAVLANPLLGREGQQTLPEYSEKVG